jgi:hypothetical protein
VRIGRSRMNPKEKECRYSGLDEGDNKVTTNILKVTFSSIMVPHSNNRKAKTTIFKSSNNIQFYLVLKATVGIRYIILVN